VWRVETGWEMGGVLAGGEVEVEAWVVIFVQLGCRTVWGIVREGTVRSSEW